MKKALLLTGLAVGVIAAANAKNVVYDNMSIIGVSPDGTYAVSGLYDQMTILNLKTGEKWEYNPDEMGLAAYSPGLGNVFSNNGIVLGSTSNPIDAAYWQDGVWHSLSVPNPAYTNMTNGITPDGSVICGSIGVAPFSLESSTMLYPAIWERQEDGTYGEAIMLPHPDKDFTGRDPQYITAIAISDDGNTIVGQMTDYVGFIQIPLVYQRTDEGWTCTNLFDTYFAIEGFQFPEDPGEPPVSPEAKDFMTEEELAAYDAAYQAWLDNCSATGTWDYSLMPEYAQFMSEEEKAQFDAALEAYYAAYGEWEEKYLEFEGAYEEYTEEVPHFVFNNVGISADGSKYITTDVIEDFDWATWTFSSESHPYVLDINGAAYKVYEADVVFSQYLPDGTMLAAHSSMETPATAYILPAGEDEFVDLYEYMQVTNPETAAWMKENMTHDVLLYDQETGSVNEVEMMITGIPYASNDLSTITTWAENLWDDFGGLAFSYVMEGKTSGIAAVEKAEALTVKMDANGNIELNQDNARSLKVCTIDGRVMLNVKAPGRTTATTLASGIYVIEATAADGTTTIAKVRK